MVLVCLLLLLSVICVFRVVLWVSCLLDRCRGERLNLV